MIFIKNCIFRVFDKLSFLMDLKLNCKFLVYSLILIGILFPSCQDKSSSVREVSSNLKKTVKKQKFEIVDGDTINLLDEEGLKQGSWKTYYKNGMIKDDYYYLNGILHGKFSGYFASGKIGRASCRERV